MGGNILARGNVEAVAKSALTKVSDMDESGYVAGVGQAFIFGIFALFDKLFVETNFKCPCFGSKPEDFEKSCERNKIYSILFVVLTTILAAFLGTAALVGLRRRYGRQRPGNGEADTFEQEVDGGKHFIICPCTKIEFLRGAGQFFVVAGAWMSVLFIDGDYIACASTCEPYGNFTCANMTGLSNDQLPFSDDFRKMSRNVSQPIGIGLGITVAVMILASLVVSSRGRCKCEAFGNNPCKDGLCSVSRLCAFQKENQGGVRTAHSQDETRVEYISHNPVPSVGDENTRL